MKVIWKHICGQRRVLCYSMRVSRALVEKFGSREAMRKKLGGEDTLEALDTSLWLVWAMMDAGKRYADLEGLDCPPAPALDELMDRYDMNDLAELQQATNEAMTVGMRQDVEAEAIEGKNGDAAQEAPTLRG